MAEGWSEFVSLERNLGEVPDGAGRNIAAAMKITSRKIQVTWRGKVAGSPGLGGLAPAVTYDLSSFQGFGASVLESEIGYDKERAQGSLGNVSEFGGPRHPARGFGLAALQENEADFEAGQQKAIDDALKAAGL